MDRSGALTVIDGKYKILRYPLIKFGCSTGNISLYQAMLDPELAAFSTYPRSSCLCFWFTSKDNKYT